MFSAPFFYRNHYEFVITKAWDIKIENLSSGYKDVTVIKSMNAHIPAQKITAVLGESGCGKTTLIKTFLGLIPIKSGKLFFADKDVTALNEKSFRIMRRRFGVLFQDGALLSSLNLLDNVALPLMEHTKLSKQTIRKAVLEILDLVGLKDAAYRYPSELSGGMRNAQGLQELSSQSPPSFFTMNRPPDLTRSRPCGWTGFCWICNLTISI